MAPGVSSGSGIPETRGSHLGVTVPRGPWVIAGNICGCPTEGVRGMQ